MGEVSSRLRKVFLDRMREQIAKEAMSVVDVEEIIQTLASTDWSKYSDDLMRQECKSQICAFQVLPEEMIENPLIILENRHYCIYCQPIMEARNTYPCDCCGLLFDRTGNNHFEVCRECYRFVDPVMRHRQRTNHYKTPATLTVRQWALTLEHFKNKCAYCGSDYEFIEHYIPLSRDGGTTWGNCLPGCSRCNIIKGNRLPEKFEKKFSSARIEAIRQYQDMIKKTPQSPYAFKEGDFVKNNIPGNICYGVVGQIQRVHVWQLGYDVEYGEAIRKKVGGEWSRFVRFWRYEMETSLVLAEGSYKEGSTGFWEPKRNSLSINKG